MRNEERIPNLASKDKSDNIWQAFGQKTVDNRLNLVLFKLSTTFGANRGQMFFDLHFEAKSEILS